jgi:hypothetical protein
MNTVLVGTCKVQFELRWIVDAEQIGKHDWPGGVGGFTHKVRPFRNG